VLDETCPVLGNIPPTRSGQIWAGTALTLHIERTDIMHRSHKPPNMTTWSIWRDISWYIVMFTLTIDLISSIFSSCLLFWWSKVEPDSQMLHMSLTAALSSIHAHIPTLNDPLMPLVNIICLGRTGGHSAHEQFLPKTLKFPSGGNKGQILRLNNLFLDTCMPWECWLLGTYLCFESIVVSACFCLSIWSAFWCKSCSNTDETVKHFIICGREGTKKKQFWEALMHRYFSWCNNFNYTEPCY
jgi:hypothetical protein